MVLFSIKYLVFYQSHRMCMFRSEGGGRGKWGDQQRVEGIKDEHSEWLIVSLSFYSGIRLDICIFRGLRGYWIGFKCVYGNTSSSYVFISLRFWGLFFCFALLCVEVDKLSSWNESFHSKFEIILRMMTEEKKISRRPLNVFIHTSIDQAKQSNFFNNYVAVKMWNSHAHKFISHGFSFHLNQTLLCVALHCFAYESSSARIESDQIGYLKNINIETMRASFRLKPQSQWAFNCLPFKFFHSLFILDWNKTMRQ